MCKGNRLQDTQIDIIDNSALVDVCGTDVGAGQADILMSWRGSNFAHGDWGRL